MFGSGLFGSNPQPASSTAPQPGSLFGSPQPQQTGLGLFGAPAQQQQQQPAGGSSLFSGMAGQQSQPTQGGFGSSLFGAPPNVTAGQPGTGLFGQPQQQQQQQPTTGLFGQPQQQQQQQPTTGLFGQPQQQQQPGTGLFGQPQQQQQPAAPAGGSSLFGGMTGQQQQQPSSLFGSTQPQQQQQQQQPSTGLFGSVGTTNPIGTVAPSFSFGSKLGTAPTATANPPSVASGGFSCNTPSTTASILPQTPAPTFSFGGAPASAPPISTQASSTGFSFGNPTTTVATAVVQPTVATTGGFSFGTPAPAPATTTSTITSTAPGLGLTFGTPTAPTTSSTLTLGGSLFGTPVTSTPQTSTLTSTPFSFASKLGAPTTLPTSTMGQTTSFGTGTFGAISGQSVTTTSTAPTPSTGLGGVPKYASTGAETTFAFGGSGDGKTENRALKELPLPQEMLLLVDELKNQIKSNKLKFTELTRSSNETMISKVTEEIEEVRGSVTVIANLIHKQTSNCEAIRKLIQEGISNAEMANITRETPISSQVDHTTPVQYFFKLFDSFRERMNIYLREIEKAENSLSSVLSVQSAFTAKELFNALKGTRDSVIVLSAKVQILHEEVIREIEAHRNLQRYLLGETKEFTLSSTHQSGYTRPFSTGLDKREGNNNYSKIGLLFPHKLVDPPKIQILNMTQNLTTTGKTTTPPAKSSTPFFSRLPGSHQVGHKSSEQSLFYPSNSLFQTQQSTILSPSQMPSTSPVPGISLKRTKH